MKILTIPLPCFCITLQTGTIFVAVFDIILTFVPLIGVFGTLLSYSQSVFWMDGDKIELSFRSSDLLIASEMKSIDDYVMISAGEPSFESTTICNQDNISSPTFNMTVSNGLYFVSLKLPSSNSFHSFPSLGFGFWVALVTFMAIDSSLSVCLLKGAVERNGQMCELWFWIRTLILVPTLICILVSLCFKVALRHVLFEVLYILYRTYTLWVVYKFTGEIYINGHLRWDTKMNLESGAMKGNNKAKFENKNVAVPEVPVRKKRPSGTSDNNEDVLEVSSYPGERKDSSFSNVGNHSAKTSHGTGLMKNDISRPIEVLSSTSPLATPNDQKSSEFISIPLQSEGEDHQINNESGIDNPSYAT